MAETIHQGRNIKRFREMMRLKQEGLAYELGEDWNQKKISLLESKEVIDDSVLEQVAKVLKITPDVIKNFDEDMGVSYFNHFHDNTIDNAFAGSNYHCTFNPLDKYVEAIEKIEKLNEENKKLYEQLLKVEREKNELLQNALVNK